ncbi:MAG: hypothetical protein AAGC99_12470 [Pseudomonadota bacterium]
MAEPRQDRAPHYEIKALTAEIIGFRSSLPARTVASAVTAVEWQLS